MTVDGQMTVMTDRQKALHTFAHTCRTHLPPSSITIQAFFFIFGSPLQACFLHALLRLYLLPLSSVVVGPFLLHMPAFVPSGSKTMAWFPGCMYGSGLCWPSWLAWRQVTVWTGTDLHGTHFLPPLHLAFCTPSTLPLLHACFFPGGCDPSPPSPSHVSVYHSTVILSSLLCCVW